MCVCERERERECVCVCVCEREREREREFTSRSATPEKQRPLSLGTEVRRDGVGRREGERGE